MLPGQGCLVGRASDVASGVAVQHKIVPGAVINAQRTGIGVQHVPNLLCAVFRSRGAAQIRHELPLIHTEDAVHLLVKSVDIEAGYAGGQKRAHHRHQGRNQQQENQRQLHMQAAEQEAHRLSAMFSKSRKG